MQRWLARERERNKAVEMAGAEAESRERVEAANAKQEPFAVVKNAKQMYNIGTLNFKTKKLCEDFTRNLLNQLGCCVIQKDNVHFVFFSNLFQYHPDFATKQQQGILAFVVERNKLRPTFFQTLVRHTDTTETAFSWVQCCRFNPRTSHSNLLRAMRNAIIHQVVLFRNNNELICESCRTETSGTTFHVDHVVPFKDLTDAFLRNTTHSIPLTFDENKLNLTIFKQKDAEFETSWSLFHLEHANLQMLCSGCNLKKPRVTVDFLN